MEVQSEDIKEEPVEIVDAALPEEISELNVKNEEIKCEPRFRVEVHSGKQKRARQTGCTENTRDATW